MKETKDESIVIVVGYVRQNDMQTQNEIKMKPIRREFVTLRKGQSLCSCHRG